MKTEKETLKKIIDILIEDMGSINPRAFHGYGAVQPYYVKSTREMLGDVEHPIKKNKKLKNPVKISKAFKKEEE
tara:strand:+ start:620 stop:841 length:222 start_codon:yes stop_codon:yes gene_type:complete